MTCDYSPGGCMEVIIDSFEGAGLPMLKKPSVQEGVLGIKDIAS